MNLKIGRNDPCWCGSGKKYKRCHWGRENLPPLNPFEVAKKQKRLFGKKYCLHPEASPEDCDRNIVRAHTVQRSGGLSRIAKDGHVYGYNPNMVSFIKNEGRVKPELIGIKEASTFTGFCQKHDSETFKAIESHPFAVNQETMFLFAYRALCREVFAKRRQSDSLPILEDLDQGLDKLSQRLLHEYHELHSLGVKVGLKEIEKIKSEYDAVLLNKDYSNVKFYVVRIRETAELMCSGIAYPDFDFDGNKLQDLTDLSARLEAITFSIITAHVGSLVIFSWLQAGNGPAHKLIESLSRMTRTDLPHAVTRFVISCSENVYFSPLWWESLKEDEREKIQSRVSDQVLPHTLRGPDAFRDDGLRVVSWTVTGFETNCDL